MDAARDAAGHMITQLEMTCYNVSVDTVGRLYAGMSDCPSKVLPHVAI